MDGRTSRCAALAAALLATLGAVAAAPADAAFPPGYPDPAFGVGGRLDLRLGAFPLASTRTVAPAAGGIAVAVDTRDHGTVGPRIARFTAVGAPVTAFGGDGVADAPVPPSSYPETWLTIAIAVDGAGGVLTLMAEDSYPSGARVLSRLRPDGTPDPAFGSGGVVDLPRGLYGLGLTALPDGGVAVVGNEGAQPFVVRLTAAGAPAPGFGVDGVARPRPGVEAQANAVIPDGPGGLLVGGEVERAGDHDRPATFRLTPTGAVDPAYGDAGASALPDGWEIASLARAPDGSVFALEGRFTGDCALYHLSAGGAHDTGYRASVGYARSVGALAVDSAGRAVVSGDGERGSSAIRRFTATGAPDTSFGAGGVVSPPETLFELGVVTSGTTVVFAGTAPFPRDPGDPVVGDTTVGAIVGGRPDPAVGPGGVRVTQLGTMNVGVVGAPIVRPDGAITILGGYRAGNHLAAPATLLLAADGRGPVEEPRALPSLGRFGAFLEPVPLAGGTTILLGTDEAADLQTTSVVLGRLGADGHADPGFGAGGLVRTALTRRALTQTHGTPVGTGFAVASGGPGDWAIGRFTAAGAPDTAFGAGGRVELNAGLPLAAATDAGGRLLVGSIETSSPLGLTVRRLLDSGEPDASFAGDGAARLAGYASDQYTSLRLLPRPDGGVLVVGTAADAGGAGIVGLRVTPIDASGTAGPASVVPLDGSTPPVVGAAQLDGRGRVLVAGTSGTYGYPFLLRLEAGAAGYGMDPAFGSGRGALTLTGELTVLGGMAIRPDGRILLTGTLTLGDPRWGVVQTLGDAAPSIDPPPAPAPPPPPAAVPPPPAVSGPAPAGPPAPIAPGPTAAVTRPPARLSAPARVTRTALARGLTVKVRCPGFCAGTLTATIDAVTARRLHLPRRRVAVVDIPMTRGTRTVTARLDRATLRRLRPLRRAATITLRLSVIGPGRAAAQRVRVTP